jgi:hypothetical protein
MRFRLARNSRRFLGTGRAEREREREREVFYGCIKGREEE